MEFTISREDLLKPLQMVSGAVERRQTLPILSNILLSAKKDQLTITATDLEVELASRIKPGALEKESEITVSARKLIDICRTLPSAADIKLVVDQDRLVIRSGKSRFVLSTLPAAEFPNVEEGKGEVSFSIAQNVLKEVLENTHFAMAQQDVRYYLNGMLFDLSKDGLRIVATDGHRLSMAQIADVNFDQQNKFQAIIPRKGITELMRLLKDDDEEIKVVIGTNHIHASTDEFTFTSKLIEGKFPDYSRVIPKNSDKLIKVDRDTLKQALARAAILSNEKFRGVRLFVTSGVLKISANNPEQEEAEEEISIDYKGGEVEIGFNVNYLLDICQSTDSTEMAWAFSDPNSSTLVENNTDIASYVYVVMPMRL